VSDDPGPGDMPSPARPAPAVSVRGVHHSFPSRGGRIEVLAGIDLHVDTSELVCILGPSGCGKSTLLRLVGGLLEPSAGQVKVNGLDPAVARRLKHFGLVPQTPALLPWRSVRQNVSLLQLVNRRERASPGDVEGLIAAVGLADFANALPAALSGGMQQRVSLARAFAGGAPVKLMDEPFSALDELTRADMQLLLLDLWARQRTTVLFVTHSVPEAVFLADRVVVMSSRPARVATVHAVELPRPRSGEVLDSNAFSAQVRAVRGALRAAAGRRLAS
jgi:NitT/TauT family transport system ATP-binding protein